MSNQHLQSNEVLRKFAPLPYQSLNSDGFIITTNEAWLDLLGYEFGEVKGEPFRSFLTADSADKFESRFPEFQASGGVSGVEFVMVCADGDEIPVSFDGQIEYADDGAVKRTHCQFRNISEQKKRESKLEASRKTFEDLFHGINDAVFMHNLNGEFKIVNQTAQERLGYDERELLKFSPTDIDVPNQQEGIEDRKEILRESGKLTFETAHVTKSGEVIPVEITSSLMNYFGEEVVLSVARDITERRKEAKDAELFRTLINQANDGIFVVDETTGKITDINQTACEMLRYSRTELVGKTVSDISEKFDSVEEYLDHISTEGNERISSMIHEHRRKDGSTIPVEVSARRVAIHDDRYRVAVVRDITDRRERERTLRRMRRAAEASGHAIYITDPEGTIEYANPAFEEITGYSKTEVVGENPRILKSGEMSDAYYEALWETVLSGEVWEEELINRRKNAELYHAHQTIAPIFDQQQAIEGFVAIQADITDRKQRENAFAKRERILRELHTTTREFVEAETEDDIFSNIVEALSSALEFTHFGVLKFDQKQGQLETQAVSPELAAVFEDPMTIKPGDSPIWKAFSEDDSRVLSKTNPQWLPTDVAGSVTDLLLVPIGDFGLIYVSATESESIDTADVELTDLLAANAETVMHRLNQESKLVDLSQELTQQESRVEVLEELMETLETIQNRLASSDSKKSLQNGICEELVKTERIDFAWIGQPKLTDTHLEPVAWAGSEQGYLDAVELADETAELPSQQAAATRQNVCIPNISAQVPGPPWAKKAISRNLQSTVSIPLVHNEVLYGVLSVYSREQQLCQMPYQNVIEDVASLFTQYLSIMNVHIAEGGGRGLEIEFRVPDENYPLHLLAERTCSTIEFETLLTSDSDTVGVLVTVTEGDPENVLDVATEISSIVEARPFGKAENRQLHLTVRRPFLGSEVTPHGGRLTSSVAGPDGTTVRIRLPEGVSVRPLAESLAQRYQEIELVGRRKTNTENAGVVRPEEVLTDRQQEILNAAYHGGYYDSPRQITGEDLATSFDISNTVVYNHLNAAHRKLLAQLFDTQSDNEGLNI